MRDFGATERGLLLYLRIMSSLGLLANAVFLWAILNGSVDSIVQFSIGETAGGRESRNGS